MRMLTLLLCGLSIACSAEESPWVFSDKGAWINWKVVDYPWRVVAGKTNFVPKAEGWYHSYGAKVIQVSGANLIVEMEYSRGGAGFPDYKGTMVLKNYPFQVVDGEILPRLIAKDVGTVSYTTVLGAQRTVRLFDYGVPCRPPPAPSPKPSLK